LEKTNPLLPFETCSWDNPTFELIHVGNPAKEAGFLFWAIVQTLLVVMGIYRLRKLVSNKYELMY
jgi:hypothetical protein